MAHFKLFKPFFESGYFLFWSNDCLMETCYYLGRGSMNICELN